MEIKITSKHVSVSWQKAVSKTARDEGKYAGKQTKLLEERYSSSAEDAVDALLIQSSPVHSHHPI